MSQVDVLTWLRLNPSRKAGRCQRWAFRQARFRDSIMSLGDVCSEVATHRATNFLVLRTSSMTK